MMRSTIAAGLLAAALMPPAMAGTVEQPAERTVQTASAGFAPAMPRAAVAVKQDVRAARQPTLNHDIRVNRDLTAFSRAF